jgi:hypothetical protein
MKELKMKIPTYYEGLVSDITADNNDFGGLGDNSVTMHLANNHNGEWYNLYYYGVEECGEISDTDEAPMLIVAKSVKTGDEIVVYDGAIHGYDNMFCDTHNQDSLLNRKLTKLKGGPLKIIISVEYSVDYDSEKECYDFLDENNVKLISGKTMLWDDVKRNAISWIVITSIDENGDEKCVTDMELS